MEENKTIDPNLEQGFKEEGSSFDIKTIFTLLVLNWQWFLVSIIIFVSGALIYLRYQPRVYQMSVKMLIKDESNNRRNAGQMLANMQDFGFISNSTGIENEIEILQSRVLSHEVVKDLKLYVEYYQQGRITKNLIYKTQPVNVDLAAEGLEYLDNSVVPFFSMTMTKEGNKYHVEGMKKEFEGEFDTLPATINTPYGALTFTKNLTLEERVMKPGGNEEDEVEEEESKNPTFIITIKSPKLVASSYASGLKIAPTSKLTSIAELTINDRSPLRASDYLTHLAVCYNRQANADKNEIAYKTEEFINDRLQKISDELGMTESQLEAYKRNNNLVQTRLDATQAMTQANQYYSKLAEASIQLQILDDLRKYMENPANKYQIIPSNIGMQDGASSSLISQYNKTVLDRNRLMAGASANSPLVQTLTETLDQMEESIKEALRQARRTADIEHKGVQKQYNEFQSKIENAPEQERILTQIGRQQEVKSGLYLMLLQKREENSISLAATADKGRLIDEPAFGGQVSPKSSIIMLAALVLGFALPLLITYLLQFMRYRIEGHEDVMRLTDVPIIADVAVANEDAKTTAGIVVHENKNNQTDEIFRAMRTNIQFMLKEHDKVILFTSSISGEGKTFNAANLAVSFALLGKKVILLGLDIRKPALGRLFELKDRSTGITNLLTKDHVTKEGLKSQIRSSGINVNLDLLLAGPTPPNPTELLARENMKEIIDLLKAEYDYIILDTAPVGLVTDTFQIAKYADVTCFVCRADFTPKSNFGIINTLKKEEKLPNLSIVINGIDMSKKKYGYYYGYGKYGKYGRYAYGYGYGRYGRYGYGGTSYGSYGNYGTYNDSHYGNKEDNSIKK
jgi:capsular exopolysaccharide synthesis family protein